MQEILSKAKGDFDKVLEVLRNDLNMVKTGRARPDLVERVYVEAYEGQPKMPILELASISAPDSQQLVIKPWDPSVLNKIAKALSASDLQLNAVVDGEMVRISIPPLTEERRTDLVKLVKQKLESGKVLLRQARHEIKETIDHMKGKPDVSEDDISGGVEDLDKLTEEYMGKIEAIGAGKEKELMTV